MNRNKVQLIGYVGQHLQAQKLQDGSRIVNLRVATHYKKKSELDKPGDTTVWHDIIAWNETALYAERNFVKGSKIMVEGPLDYREYTTQQGIRHRMVQIVATKLINLDR